MVSWFSLVWSILSCKHYLYDALISREIQQLGIQQASRPISYWTWTMDQKTTLLAAFRRKWRMGTFLLQYVPVSPESIAGLWLAEQSGDGERNIELGVGADPHIKNEITISQSSLRLISHDWRHRTGLLDECVSVDVLQDCSSSYSDFPNKRGWDLKGIHFAIDFVGTW